MPAIFPKVTQPMKELSPGPILSLSFLCHGSQIYHALLLTLEGMQNPIPTWVTRCPGLTRMTQELGLLSAWLCADIREECPSGKDLGTLWRGDTHAFYHLVPGGWGIILSRLALESTWLPLFEGNIFSSPKSFPFFLKKNDTSLHIFVRLLRGLLISCHLGWY